MWTFIVIVIILICIAIILKDPLFPMDLISDFAEWFSD